MIGGGGVRGRPGRASEPVAGHLGFRDGLAGERRDTPLLHGVVRLVGVEVFEGASHPLGPYQAAADLEQAAGTATKP